MIKPIRILQVVGKMNRGGAESMIMELYRHIDRNSFQFDFVEHTDERCCYDDEIEQLGGRIYYIPQYCGFNHYAYVSKWKNIFREHDEYKIVHCHIRSTASIICKIAKRYGLKTISHSHNTYNGNGVGAFVKSLLQKRIVKYADFLLACSTEAGRWLFGKHIEDKNRFFLFNNAIDAKKFDFDENLRAEKRAELKLNSYLVVGTVGRLTQQKNPFGIIKIVKELSRLTPDIRFLWIGVGEMEADIRHAIHLNGLDDIIIMLGASPKVNEWMQAMDVFILPSFWEGLPVVAIEAQTAGLPCLISDTVSSEVVLTDNCKLISVDKVSDWVDNIMKMSAWQRQNTYPVIKSQNYDIVDNTERLIILYTKLFEV